MVTLVMPVRVVSLLDWCERQWPPQIGGHIMRSSRLALMLRPDYKEFFRLAREATLVPVVKSVTADLLTPVSAFLAIAAKSRTLFCWSR